MIKEYTLQKLQNGYEVTLHYKGVNVRVAFTGGNVYNGTRPKFRTDNTFKMKALEASELFKNKEVVLTRTIGDSAPVVSRKAASDRSSRIKPIEKATVTSLQAGKKGSGKTAAGEKREVPVNHPSTEDTAEAPVAEDTAPVEQGNTMEFPNLAEAILYIAQTWQIEVQTEAEARRVLKEHGITPRIKKG